MGADAADGDAGEAGKGAVDGVLAEDGAHDGIVSVGDAASNHVGGIDVLDVALELSLELLAEPLTDIAELRIAAGVGTTSGDVLLSRALREDDDGVALGVEGVAHVLNDAVRAVSRPIDLWYEATVNKSVRQSGKHGDETALTSHELDDADASVRALRLNGGSLNRLLSLFDSRVETERLIQEQNIVINCLRHANHGHLDATLGALVANRVGPGVRTVAANDENHVDAVVDNRLDNLLDVSTPSPRSENRTTSVMNISNVLSIELHERITGKEAFKSVSNAADLLHSITNLERVHDRTNHIIDPGTEPTAGDDRGVYFF